MVPPHITPTREIKQEVQDTIRAIGAQFAIEGDFLFGEELVSGHVNSTYRATYQLNDDTTQRFILQRINEKVFKTPIDVMKNVERVTRHINLKVLRAKNDRGGQTLNLYPSREGKSYIHGPNGGIWRCYNNIEGCITYDVAESTRQAYQAARAFGSFQNLISDLDPSKIRETIPNFHNTPQRFQNLLQSAKIDAHQRAQEVQPELDFVLSQQAYIPKLIELTQANLIPTRITHNDTKINNVMFDEETDEAVCVIDLDTVMPGLSLYDFGDLMRSATSPTDEDETNLDLVHMEMPMFQALVEGYIEGCNGCLNHHEISNLALAGKLMTLEVGMRFLTDYLDGDIYFRAHREKHNLDRARNQFALVRSITSQESEIKEFISKFMN